MTTAAPDRTPNVLNDRCPSRQVIEMLADKWSILILHALRNDTLRYGELQRRVTGISQKMLTQTLRDLERHGLIDRQVHQVVPPQVEYRLTDLGVSLGGVLGGICGWAQQHMHEVHTARERYEAQQER